VCKLAVAKVCALERVLHRGARMTTSRFVTLMTVIGPLVALSACAVDGSAIDEREATVDSDRGKSDSFGQLPDLSEAPDDNTPLELLEVQANNQLPDGRRVDFENLIVDPAVPDLADVLDAYAIYLDQQGVEVLGAADEVELAEALAEHRFSGALEAARQITGDDQYVIGKVFLVTEPAPSAPQWETFYLIYFPSSARVIVLDLVAFEV
jgi:hypothetical protein